MNRYQFFSLLESGKGPATGQAQRSDYAGRHVAGLGERINLGARKALKPLIDTQRHRPLLHATLKRAAQKHGGKIMGAAGLGLAGLAGAGIRHGLKKRSARIAGEKAAAMAKASQGGGAMKFLRKHKGKAALAAGATGLAGMMFMRKKSKDKK